MNEWVKRRENDAAAKERVEASGVVVSLSRTHTHAAQGAESVWAAQENAKARSQLATDSQPDSKR